MPVVRGNATDVLLATDCETPKSATVTASEMTYTMMDATGRMVTEESEGGRVVTKESDGGRVVTEESEGSRVVTEEEMGTDSKENQVQLPAQMPTGLDNLGNSCFMNSCFIVQCICNTSGLRSFLLDELYAVANQDSQFCLMAGCLRNWRRRLKSSGVAATDQ